MNLKEMAGRRAVEYVEEGMVIGLGTGSTAAYAIKALGERVAEGLQIQAISTSEASTQLATQLGIAMKSFEDETVLDLTIDGADEVDPNLNLIKGLGGALLREKIVAAATTLQIIIVDTSKLVNRLGTRSPLPVEVVPFGWPLAQRHLIEQDLRAELRKEAGGDEPIVTDNGNFILDCHFPDGIDDAAGTERRINAVPSVVENGLFVGLTDLVIVAEESGNCRIIERT